MPYGSLRPWGSLAPWGSLGAGAAVPPVPPAEAAWAGGVAAGGSAGVYFDPYLPPASAAAVLEAIRAALEATREFDVVWDAGEDDPRGRPAKDLLAVGVEAGPATAETLGDAGPDGLTIVTLRASLRIVVRRDDAALRDADARRLLAVARNALDGRKLVATGWPDWARVLDWRELPAVDVERQVLATYQHRWHEEGWAAASLAV